MNGSSRGKLLVISGPSGAGKTSICKTLLQRLPKMCIRDRCEAESCAAQLTGLDVVTVVNADWARGIGISLRAGVAQLQQTAEATAAVVTLCDQPYVNAAALRRLVAARVETGAPIVAARYDGTLGVPALFAASLFDRLCALPDDAGAKRILQEEEPRVFAVELPEARGDIDTEADLRRLREENLTQRRRGAKEDH